MTTGQDTPVDVTLSATDVDGNDLTYSVVEQPVHGTLSGSGPDLIYTPAPGYSGPDTFTFTAKDEQFDSNTATVTITVNPPPTDLETVTLPPEWIGSDSVSMRVLQPKVTIVPAIARPGRAHHGLPRELPAGCAAHPELDARPRVTRPA